jgi:hypothetical protein
MRSSTSSSDDRPRARQVLGYIFLPLLLVVMALTGIELLYRQIFGPLDDVVHIPDLKSVQGYREVLADPGNEILALGDSRFETSFDPVSVAEAFDRPVRALNLAVSSGNVVYQMEELIRLGCENRTLVVLTTPGTVVAWKGRIRPTPRLESWYYHVERHLTHFFNSKLLIANGQPLFFYTIGLRNTVNIQQPDGWLKVITRRDSDTVDSYVLRKWVEDHAAAPPLDQEVLSRFERAIARLRARNNQILLVRSPVLPEYREVTNRYYPRFDEIMHDLAGRHGIRYLPSSRFDLHSGISYDGVHYDHRRAEELSRRLGEMLNGSTHGG